MKFGWQLDDMRHLGERARQLIECRHKGSTHWQVNLTEGVIHPQPRSDVQLACSNHADDVLDFAGAGR
ncbi:hypothetical protein [Mariniblastus fucicola]|uniref:hypothetical protein n=1 Tax=Mariniblastus fucicola TaxID=980251 RepID=UPI0009465F06|nr:hypothetical protein [Mariniblastus fucicola]